MCTVLLVETARDKAKARSTALAAGGHRVLVAANGRHACEAFDAERVDVVVLDLPPEDTGAPPANELAAFVWALAEERGVPLVVHAASGPRPDDLWRCPADEYVDGSGAPGDLVAAISRVVRPDRPAHGLPAAV